MLFEDAAFLSESMISSEDDVLLFDAVTIKFRNSRQLFQSFLVAFRYHLSCLQNNKLRLSCLFEVFKKDCCCKFCGNLAIYSYYRVGLIKRCIVYIFEKNYFVMKQNVHYVPPNNIIIPEHIFVFTST